MSLSFRVQDLDARWRSSTSAAARSSADPIESKDERGGTLPLRRDRDPARRRRVPLRRADRLPRLRPRLRRLRAPGNAVAPRERLRHRRDRSRDLERAHDAADRRLVPRRARLRAVLGDQLPHAGRRQGARERLGAPVDRDVGPGERREVRDQRAAAAVLPRVADHQVRRGQRGQRRAARRLRRDEHPLVGRGARAPRRRVHEDAPGVLPRPARRGSRSSASRT